MNEEMIQECLREGFNLVKVGRQAAETGCINFLRIAYQILEGINADAAEYRATQNVAEKLQQGLPVGELFPVCLHICVKNTREKQEVPFELAEALDIVEDIYVKLLDLGQRVTDDGRVTIALSELEKTCRDIRGVLDEDGMQFTEKEALVQEFEKLVPRYVRKCQQCGAGAADQAILKSILRIWKKIKRVLAGVVQGNIGIAVLAESPRIREYVMRCIRQYSGRECKGLTMKQTVQLYSEMVKGTVPGMSEDDFEKLCFEVVLASVV